MPRDNSKITSSRPLAGSFRDPNGFLFSCRGTVYRRVNFTYKENYDHLMSSGLYSSLVDSGLLVPHEEEGADSAEAGSAYKILKPRSIPFISYPYEWCFSQLRAAALTTLRIQREALRLGMTLKDGSAYNVKFIGAQPVFIDTLSFEKYREGSPWIAYRQFCQHFLCPLALMSYRDIRLNQLLRVHLDGIPLDLASSILPLRTYFRFSLLSSIHLHARSQEHFADKGVNARSRRMSRVGLLALIDNLEASIYNLKCSLPCTAWGNYYDEDSRYSADALLHKRSLVGEFLDQTRPQTVWDFGANTGLFSRLASQRGIYTVSFDMDPVCVERNYLQSVKAGEANILPLLLDLTNPSPPMGWENQERMSVLDRGPADAVFALALIHHLTIGNNLPLVRVAEFLAKAGNSLVIEFVPKSDSQVQRLLSTREDIFPDYTPQAFEAAFLRYFAVCAVAKIRGSERTLYLMQNKSAPA